MNELEYLIELHKHNHRQGPGSDEVTELALRLTGLRRSETLKVADIGCGTGASALHLARLLPNAKIVAVDFLDAFLEVLHTRARLSGVEDRVVTSHNQMDELPFEEGSIDLIWSEGAIYNIGFKRGISLWRKFLRNRGVLAVSEICWLTYERPEEIETHWNRAYSEIGTVSEKIKQLEKAGFSLLGYLTLPQSCWMQHYYTPLEDRFTPFLEKNNYSKTAVDLVKAEKREIELYKKYHQYVGYGFYIARKSGV